MRSPPTASPPSRPIGTSALARCWVEAIRPVAPLTMMPMVLVGMGFPTRERHRPRKRAIQ